MTEHALLFQCAHSTLVGVLSLPAVPASTAVVIVVGGPQYRVGSHRQFVLLARALAAGGYAVLRFDYQGMGDSQGPAGDFLTASPGICAAMDNLQSHLPQVKKNSFMGSVRRRVCSTAVRARSPRPPRGGPVFAEPLGTLRGQLGPHPS